MALLLPTFGARIVAVDVGAATFGVLRLPTSTNRLLLLPFVDTVDRVPVLRRAVVVVALDVAVLDVPGLFRIAIVVAVAVAVATTILALVETAATISHP